MLSLHQLRCFTAAYEHRSFTAAATELGYAQPSLSEQVRLLERAVGAPLFTRAGRGVVPTEAGEALLPHAQRTLAAAAQARAAVASVATLETGTLRFGIFGTARLYMGAALISDVLERHPGLRVELIGQNSSEVLEELRRGRLEAAMISLPVADDTMLVRPGRPGGARLRQRRPVAPDDARDGQGPGRGGPRPARGHVADAGRQPRRPRPLRAGGRVSRSRRASRSRTWRRPWSWWSAGWRTRSCSAASSTSSATGSRRTSARCPCGRRLYDTIAVVHRRDAVLSAGANLVIELAVARIRAVTEPLRDR
jgi:DNA-binding transcriptional LysR family regulator